MLSAWRAITRSGSIGEPLPHVDALGELHEGHFKWTPRGGQVTMIAGMPASQKSGLATFVAANWAKMGLAGLYISADMDRHTATTRTAAALSGHQVDSVAKSLDSGGAAFYADVLDVPLSFSFNPSPSLDDVRLEVDAYVETYGAYPRFMVVDNLLDIDEGGDSETSAYKLILLELKTMARETGALILVLHHMSEAGGDPFMPAPRSRVMGKVTQTPENVLSIAFDPHRDQLVGSLVKHRNGPASATAEIVFRLDADPSRNQFRRHEIYRQTYGETT